MTNTPERSPGGMMSETAERMRRAEDKGRMWLRIAVVIQFTAGKMCVRMRSNPNGPTCRSTVPGEGLPEDDWCISCIAREILEKTG